MPYDDSDDDDLDISIRRRGGEGGNIPNYLVFAILTTIFCCWPLGIPAIVYAAKVNSLIAQGEYDAARSASNTALTLCIVNMVVGLIAMFAYCGLVGMDAGRHGF